MPVRRLRQNVRNREVNAPVFLTGPTAVGKSAVALSLAEAIGGEIISVDSMQVYRGLDIGTAKPTAAERQQIPHHLLDVADLSEAFDAATFIRLAQAAVKEIQARGRTPIFCGGTGLYFKAYLEGLGEAPPGDPQIRAELEATPLEVLLTELATRDPETIARIDQKNPRRVIRALEVIRITGQPFSAQRATWTKETTTAGEQPLLFGLARQPEDLRRRMEARVDEMFAQGLVAETERLLKQELAENRTAMQAIGYRQVVEHLYGERPLKETIDLVKTRTRQFTKRQLTWFRRQLPVTWLELTPDSSATAVVADIQARWRTRGLSS